MSAQDEAVRFERLRAQADQPVVPPPNIAGMCGSGGLDPAHVPTAETMWNDALGEMSRAPSYPAEERLYWSTFLLASLAARNGQRAMAVSRLQSALPYLQQVRHQQVTTGLLVRNLAALGQLDQASALLPSLQTHSDDLQVDTSYRFSSAYVALLRHDAQTILSLLGATAGDIPISKLSEAVCGVFRAHAHEALGDLNRAEAELRRLAPTPDHVVILEQIVRATPEVPLVPRSLMAAKMTINQLHQNPVKTNSGINVRRIMLVAFVGAPLMFVGAVGSEALLPSPWSGYAMAAIITVTTLGILVAVFGGLARAAARKKRLLASGLEGVAQLLSVEQTGTRVNDQPMLRLRMLVTVPGRPAYAVLHNEIVPGIRLAMVTPGIQLRVRVDAKDPRSMAIAW